MATKIYGWRLRRRFGRKCVLRKMRSCYRIWLKTTRPMVFALLDAGVPIDSRGDMGETALHWACWKGFADLAKLLVERGASLTIEDAQYHGTPPGWFGHGGGKNGEGGD